jgi:SUKH-4 immunity protein of toxin-antitoxin system
MTDADDRADRGPHFELVAFPEPTGIPHAFAAPLLERGAPKAMLGRYHAAPALTLLEVPDHGQFVRFGTNGLYGAICLDPRTRAVVEVGTFEEEATINAVATGIPGPPSFVNSSLDQFIASVRAVLDRFPFGGGEAGMDSDIDRLESEWNRAADELEATLGVIDPALVNANAYWLDFLSDVRIGDFSTAEVLDRLGRPEA